MSVPNEEKGSPEETERFFLELGRILDSPPLSEEFHERVRQRFKRTSSSTEGSAQAHEIPNLPPSEIQPLTQDLIEAALDALDLDWERDENNDLFVVIQGENDPVEMGCWFLTNENHLFSLHCLVFPPIPKSKFLDAVLLCNEYALQKPFGRFQVRIKAEEEEATLWFDAHLDLCNGTTAAFLQTFIDSHLSSADAFLSGASVQQLLFRSAA
jgi:hypothetical protein